MKPRIFIPLFVVFLAALLTACPYQKPEPARPDANPPKPLDPGQTVTIEFPADGQWHPAPILVRNQEEIVIQPAASAAAISGQALRFRVGQVPQMLRPGERVAITMPGKMWFMVDRRFYTGPSDPIAVIVKRVK